MYESTDPMIESALRDRRDRLESALVLSPEDPQLRRLFGEVDAALDRLARKTFGLCEVCKDPIEPERLQSDPLVRFCIDHMSPPEQQALEEDLELASRIQGALLPPRSWSGCGWAFAYHYQAAGAVSGDYCDLLPGEDGVYFMVGDVTGKGVAASMLMAHLHATFRALVTLNLPLESVMARASRMFCESTLSTYFATLVCGRAMADGAVEVCNAGHLAPLIARDSGIEALAATTLPMGIFCDGQFPSRTVRMEPGETMLVYTDGVPDTENATGKSYGDGRVGDLLRVHRLASPAALVASCLEDVRRFREGARQTDDVTVMALKRLPAGV